MDNSQQPTQPVEQPPVNSDGAASTDSNNTNDNYSPTPTTSQGDVILQSDSSKKKGKGPIIAIIAIIAALLIGGGAFAAVTMMSSQPDKIILSAASNLLNAKSISANGTMEMTVKEPEMIGFKSFKMESTTDSKDLNTSGTYNFSITLANDTEINLGVGSVIMSDGVLYFKIDGLKDTYENNIKEMLAEEIQTTIRANRTVNSSDEGEDPELIASVEQYMTSIDSIIDSVEGKWIRVSVDEILDSELMEMTGLDSATKQMISSAYKCAFGKLNDMSQYSDDFAELYGQNPFIVMNKGQDDFYDITYDEEKLANFINTMPKMKLVGDLASCVSYPVPSDMSLDVTASDLAPLKDSIGQISAKFDGLFDHHLTELKTYQDTEYGTVTSDMVYNYSSSAQVSAPSDSTPIMDVVEEILMTIGDMPLDESVIDIYEEDVVDLIQ